MINHRIRTIVSTAAGSTLVASALGLAALGFSGAANAAPAHAPQAGPAPQTGHVCGIMEKRQHRCGNWGW